MVAEGAVRDSLKHSLADSPAGAGESFRYPKGSIVLCNACAVPMAKLDHGIALGDKGGRMVNAFKPLRSADIDTLAAREDIDAGVIAWARGLTPEAKKHYLGALREFKTGDPMSCPICAGCFVQVIAAEKDAVMDRAYVIELVTIPPEGQRGVAVRGRQIGATKGWVHESAKGVH